MPPCTRLSTGRVSGHPKSTRENWAAPQSARKTKMPPQLEKRSICPPMTGPKMGATPLMSMSREKNFVSSVPRKRSQAMARESTTPPLPASP